MSRRDASNSATQARCDFKAFRFALALPTWFLLLLVAYLPVQAGHQRLGLAAACGVLWFFDADLGMVLVGDAGPAQPAQILAGCQRARSIAVTRTTLNLQLSGVVLLPALILATGGGWRMRCWRILRWTPLLVLLQGAQLALAGWASSIRLQGAGSWAGRLEQLAGAGAWVLPVLLWGWLEWRAPLGPWRTQLRAARSTPAQAGQASRRGQR
jgi:hypothetical protein